MTKVIEFDFKCKACSGTGLYVGIGERDGSAVVCSECKGTGKARFKFEYDEFDRRSARMGVLRVMQFNPGICIGTGSGHRLEQFGGMPYADWENGQPFPEHSEMREFACPAWWYQLANYNLKPGWKKCTGGAFPFCEHFGDKVACWKEWDIEFGSRVAPETRKP